MYRTADMCIPCHKVPLTFLGCCKQNCPKKKLKPHTLPPAPPRKKNSNTKKNSSTILITNMNDMSIHIHPSLSPYLLGFSTLKIPCLLLSLAIILPNDSHLLPQPVTGQWWRSIQKATNKNRPSLSTGSLFNV